MRQHPIDLAGPPAAQAAGPVVVGLDGGYVRSRHRPERHFEVVAGKVIDARGAQHRFAFARNGPAASVEAFRQALMAAGGRVDTPATVLCDGDAGLWRLQRAALPGAAIVLDWWHAAVRFEHARQAARGLGAGPADAFRAHPQLAPWSVPSGVSGTGAGRGAGANSLPCAAGQDASPYARWPALAASSDTLPTYGLSRTQPGSASARRGPASVRRADLDG